MEKRLDRIEKLLETMAEQTAANTREIHELRVSLSDLSQIVAENYMAIRTDIKALDRKISGTPDEIDQTYGGLLNELTDRVTKLEKMVKTK